MITAIKFTRNCSKMRKQKGLPMGNPIAEISFQNGLLEAAMDL